MGQIKTLQIIFPYRRSFSCLKSDIKSSSKINILYYINYDNIYIYIYIYIYI